VIEDVAIIAGIQFRFIDTAGIRDTNDIIETKGIEKTFLKIEQAEIVLIVIDATDFIEDINLLESIFREKIAMKESVFIINKIDIAEDRIVEELKSNAQNFGIDPICISAKNGDNFVELENYLIKVVEKMKFAENDVIISNVRHYEALQGAIEPLDRVIEGLKNDVSGDFLSQDIREALYSLGSITGHVSTDEILGNIFKNFCIGK
jgi:tRNA modification GTPase